MYFIYYFISLPLLDSLSFHHALHILLVECEFIAKERGRESFCGRKEIKHEESAEALEVQLCQIPANVCVCCVFSPLFLFFEIRVVDSAMKERMNDNKSIRHELAIRADKGINERAAKRLTAK